MKKLSKGQVKEHTELSAALGRAKEGFDAAIVRFNEAVAKAYAELQPAVEALNGAAVKANDFIGAIYDEQATYYDERSDGWRDGDAGSVYSDWMSEWELALDEVEVEEPEELETAEVDLEAFDQLATEVSS